MLRPDFVVAVTADKEQTLVCRFLHDQSEQSQQIDIGPVEVFQDDQRRAARAQVGEGFD